LSCPSGEKFYERDFTEPKTFYLIFGIQRGTFFK